MSKNIISQVQPATQEGTHQKTNKKAKKYTFKHLSFSDRLKIEAWLKAGIDKKLMAEYLGVSFSTIYREIKRGLYTKRNSDWTETECYSATIAEEKYRKHLKEKGSELKIGNDIKLANYIEDKICNEKYSPDAVIGELKASGKFAEFNVTICTRTLYNYIDMGLFITLSNDNLPVKRNKKKKKCKVRRNKQARANAGTSIEKRSDEILTREEFGHWEMDTVVGKRGVSKHSFLVLSERKTRDEIIIKLKEHTASAVVSAIDHLEEKWGDKFTKIFKSITVDNGTEFAFCSDMERSILYEGKQRVELYYCHPYSSYERGTNENQNKLIRRFAPKGTNFDSMTDEEVEVMQNWINSYPRRMFGYRSADDLFKEEISKIA